MPIGIRAARARPLGIRRFFRPEVKYHLEPDEWPELATHRNCLPQTELTYRLALSVPYICRCAGTAIHYLDPPAEHAAPIDPITRIRDFRPSHETSPLMFPSGHALQDTTRAEKVLFALFAF